MFILINNNWKRNPFYSLNYTYLFSLCAVTYAPPILQKNGGELVCDKMNCDEMNGPRYLTYQIL